MQQVDLRAYKKELREKSKNYRRGMDPQDKAGRDSRIRQRLQCLYQYPQARTILCYVSKKIEIDTFGIIEDALAAGKRVAVPRCVEGTRLMDFYLIHSAEDMEKGSFGVLEPVVERCEKLTDFSRSICIVPALGYDLEGYRLGYGGGYYDRFLSGYKGLKVGVIYAACVCPRLPRGKFDVPVDVLLTEKYLRTIRSRGNRVERGRFHFKGSAGKRGIL